MLIIDVYNKVEWDVGGDEVGRARKSMCFSICFFGFGDGIGSSSIWGCLFIFTDGLDFNDRAVD